MKVCSRCKISKDLNEFHNTTYSKDGKKYSCKQCEKNRRKAPLKRTEIICPKCNIKRSITAYSAKRRKSDYCSKCARFFHFKGVKRPEFSKENSPNWKGGSYISSGGYRMIRCENEYLPSGRQKYRPEHVILMEKHLGRHIKTEKNGGGESIHHIDGDKLNNRIDNLILCKSNQDHRLLHTSLEKVAFSLVRNGLIEFDKETREYKIRKNKNES